MTEQETITEIRYLLSTLKTPYIFIVRDGKAIRTMTFPTPPVAGELLGRAAVMDENIGKVLTETMKLIKFKPT